MVLRIYLNPEGQQNPTSGSKVMAILLKVLILTIGGASSGRVCAGFCITVMSEGFGKASLSHKTLKFRV